MKRLWLACLAVLGVGGAVVLSGARNHSGVTFFARDDRNPVTHLRWNDDPADFHFAIVSDRTGGHRAEIFSQAVEKLNLLQPDFVLSIGDLIEGGKKPSAALEAEWKEFNSHVQKLHMPFFYVPGNHDVDTRESAKVWQEKFGRRYYHFVYRKVLFLILNAEDMQGIVGGLGTKQIADIQKTLTEHADVRWTIVAIHRPLWTVNNGDKNGWREVEQALQGRSYTVVAGHEHRYEKFVRQGMNYYQFATTGGSSLMRGVQYGEFDHLVLVRMKKDGPVLANLLLDAVQAENLQKFKTDEPGSVMGKRLLTYPVRGLAYYEGVPMPGATVHLVRTPGGKGPSAHGRVEPDGSFLLTTYQAFDGAPEGDYQISITWREKGKTGESRVPAKYASSLFSGLRATIRPGTNEVRLELKQ